MNDLDIFGIGNPLLDITATVDEDFLKKYNLPKHSTLLAKPEHESMYEDLENNYDIEYSAGGATQNALRYCQWVVGINTSVTTFLGCVGNDYFGKIMEKKAKHDGVNVKYMVANKASTGSCAVLITNGGKFRSVVANIGASAKFDKDYIKSNFNLAETARVYFTSGHMLRESGDSVMYLAKYAQEWGKDFFFNLAAPYVSQNCSNHLADLIPYIDFFFANADEAAAFAIMKGYHKLELKEVAKLISQEPKLGYKSCRVVIITRGENPIILARSDSVDVKEYPVPQLKEDAIKDTNGAGDAFIGGFLAMHIMGKPLDTCIKCAIYCAHECIQQTGCALPKDMKFKP